MKIKEQIRPGELVHENTCSCVGCTNIGLFDLNHPELWDIENSKSLKKATRWAGAVAATTCVISMFAPSAQNLISDGVEEVVGQIKCTAQLIALQQYAPGC